MLDLLCVANRRHDTDKGRTSKRVMKTARDQERKRETGRVRERGKKRDRKQDRERGGMRRERKREGNEVRKYRKNPTVTDKREFAEE